jgi:hypothetical protein
MGLSPADQTCDTRKGEEAIRLNPLDPAHASTLRCKSEGRLESTDPQFQEDIDERLNLNHRVLVAARRAKLQRELRPLQVRHRAAPIPESAIRALIAETETPTGGKLPELCCVLRLWARRRFGGAW